MEINVMTNQKLAILGGAKALPDHDEYESLFHWPIVTEEDEQAMLEVLRAGSMSGTEITKQFEQEYAAYQGTKYALAHSSGTMSLLAAMFAAGLGRGDEMICPTITYWASALQAFSLGATVIFADAEPHSLCIDPNDIEHRITPRTKAIMVVHYAGYPCDMDLILAIARKHELKVIEDVSHAHGSMYKGKMCGSLGDVAGMSMMSGKSFAIGEGGMLTTDDDEIYQRAIAFAHYERHSQLTHPDLKPLAGLPLGGVKGRMNQTVSAMGRVQLKHYPARTKQIENAMTRFFDALDEIPGLQSHRPPQGSDVTMGGWYAPFAHYDANALDGLPLERFVKAVNAEGIPLGCGLNHPLHLHPVFNDADVYGDGKPIRIAFVPEDIRQPAGSLPVAESKWDQAFFVPWFKHDNADAIEKYVAVFRKVSQNANELK